MQLALVISLAAILASLYILGLITYRLWLSAKSFKAQRSQLDQKIKLLSQPLERPIEAAKPSAQGDLAELLAKREQDKRQRLQSQERRRRKLIERLQTLDLDKR